MSFCCSFTLVKRTKRVVLVQNKMPKFVVDAFSLAHEYASDIKYFGTTNFESAIEYAYAIASFMIAQTRSGTNFALSSDETIACNAQPRISELIGVLNTLTSSGEQLVLREHDRICPAMGFFGVSADLASSEQRMWIHGKPIT